MQRDDFIIRRAERRDIVALADACRRSFPHVLRWRLGGEPARRWWESAVASPCCETWVAAAGTAVAGFIVLVTDERAWRAERAHRRASRKQLLRAAACRPWMVLAHLPRAGRTHTRGAASSAPPPTRGTPPAERTWIELIAVDPSCRGLGLALRLLDHAEQRTKRLRRRAIHLSVGAANRSAIRCYAAAGFGTVHQADDGLVLGKRLIAAA